MSTQLGFADEKEYPSFPRFRFDSALAACTGNDLSQYDGVLYILQSARGYWVCNSFFYGSYMPTARNRVGEIRANFGFDFIASERCDDPEHHHRPRSGVYRYRYTE